MFDCCECCVFSGRGLCDGLITRPEGVLPSLLYLRVIWKAHERGGQGRLWAAVAWGGGETVLHTFIARRN